MSDDRPPSRHPTGPSYEVPVVGDGPLAEREGSAGGPPLGPAPNWRKISGLTALAGVGLGILASVVLPGFVWNDDENDGATDDDTASSVAPSDLAALITTPPTLSQLETIPRVDEAPTGTVGPGALPREASLLDQVVVPTAPPAAGDITASPDSFDLAAAVDELDDDLARRSSTHLELGVAGYIREYTILRDPVADRYALNFGGLVSITDESSDLSYVDVSSFDEEQWVSLESVEIADRFGVDRAGVLYDQMLRGPLRPDTLSSAAVTPGDFVTLPPTETVARAFEIELPGSAIPEWQLYAFGPTDEFVPSDRPDRLTYTVYVDEDNQIRRLVGLSDLGGIPQLVVHDIETLTEPAAIELPNPAKVIPGSPLTAD